MAATRAPTVLRKQHFPGQVEDDEEDFDRSCDWRSLGWCRRVQFLQHAGGALSHGGTRDRRNRRPARGRRRGKTRDDDDRRDRAAGRRRIRRAPGGGGPGGARRCPERDGPVHRVCANGCGVCHDARRCQRSGRDCGGEQPGPRHPQEHPAVPCDPRPQDQQVGPGCTRAT